MLRRLLGLDHIDHRLAALNRTVHKLKELTMANFDALNAKIDEYNAAVSAAAGRVQADFDDLKAQIAALELDGDDQTSVDAATAKMQTGIDALNNLDQPAPETL